LVKELGSTLISHRSISLVNVTSVLSGTKCQSYILMYKPKKHQDQDHMSMNSCICASNRK